MNGHHVQTEFNGDPNPRLYCNPPKSSFVYEIDARVCRLKVKRAAAERKRQQALAVPGQQGRKAGGWTPEDTAKVQAIRARRDAAIPFLRAFKAFGAKKQESLINSSDFEMGLRKLTFNFNRKTVLEIYGAYIDFLCTRISPQ
jgi:hypothetical protein